MCFFFFLDFHSFADGRVGVDCACDWIFYLGPTSPVASARVRKNSPFQLPALPLNVLSSFIFLSIP